MYVFNANTIWMWKYIFDKEILLLYVVPENMTGHTANATIAYAMATIPLEAIIDVQEKL